jgi:hypothetical protein
MRVKSSEIKPGMIVREHGMRVRIDSVREYPSSARMSQPPSVVYSCLGTVLNLDEVREAKVVPMSFLTRDEWVEGKGWTVTRNDAWTVQGNDLAQWEIEEAEPQKEAV